MSNYKRAMRTLEYDKILAMLAERAPTDGAKEMALALTPENDPDRILRMQRQTTEAKSMQAIKGMPSFGRVKDIRDTAERAEKAVSDRMMRLFAESVVSMTDAENLIVIRTLVASAQVAAEAIDSMNWPEIAGTLAGENTIFVAVKAKELVPSVMSRFRGMMK